MDSATDAPETVSSVHVFYLERGSESTTREDLEKSELGKGESHEGGLMSGLHLRLDPTGILADAL